MDFSAKSLQRGFVEPVPTAQGAQAPATWQDTPLRAKVAPSLRLLLNSRTPRPWPCHKKRGTGDDGNAKGGVEKLAGFGRARSAADEEEDAAEEGAIAKLGKVLPPNFHLSQCAIAPGTS